MPEHNRLTDEAFIHDRLLTPDDLRRSMGFDGFDGVDVQIAVPTGDQREMSRARDSDAIDAARFVYGLSGTNGAFDTLCDALRQVVGATERLSVVLDDTPLLPIASAVDATERATSMQHLLDMLLAEDWEEDAMRWTPDRGAEEIEAWQQLLRQRRSR